jgi:hypothetical protein
MGAGDDEITIDTVTEDDSIDGGADTDTIRGTTAALAAIEADADQLAAIVNFEQLAVTDAVANDVDLTEWGFNKISIEDGGTSAGTITMDSDDTIAFDEAAVLGADTSTGLIVADVDGASGAGSGDDVVNLEANVNFTGTFDFTALVDTAFVETVNIAVTDTATATVGTGYAEFEIGEATRIQTINVSASQETIVAEASAFPQDLFVALNTFNASDSTAKVTVDVTNATQGVTMTGGEGDDDFTGSAFADIVDMGDGDNTYMASGGADAITLGAGANNLDYSVAAGDSTEANMDTITGFNAVLDATKVDTLTTLSGAIDVDSAADTDVSAADVDAGTVTANITDGMIELGGADAANIDTLAEWIDVAEIMVTVDAGVAGNVGFEFDGNTYVLDANAANATSNVVELTGVTGATLGAAAAADVIVIA